MYLKIQKNSGKIFEKKYLKKSFSQPDSSYSVFALEGT
jgi:hypothetical protein